MRHFRHVVASGFVCLLLASLTHADDDSSKRDWNLTVGAGVTSYPEYPGSDHQKTLWFPLIVANYGHFFVGDPAGDGGGGIGYRFVDDEHWRLAVFASGGFVKVRTESDDPRLHGLGDIDGTERVGVAATYTASWFNARLSAASDVAGNHEGTLVKFTANAGFQPTKELTLHAGPTLTWGNDSYVQTLYGIDAQQSQRSGRPIYTASSGLTRAGIAFGADYDITSRWSVGANFTYARLEGDAANSPIVRKRWQNSALGYISYDF
jgi:outer membrane protein